MVKLDQSSRLRCPPSPIPTPNLKSCQAVCSTIVSQVFFSWDFPSLGENLCVLCCVVFELDLHASYHRTHRILTISRENICIERPARFSTLVTFCSKRFDCFFEPICDAGNPTLWNCPKQLIRLCACLCTLSKRSDSSSSSSVYEWWVELHNRFEWLAESICKMLPK